MLSLVGCHLTRQPDCETPEERQAMRICRKCSHGLVLNCFPIFSHFFRCMLFQGEEKKKEEEKLKEKEEAMLALELKKEKDTNKQMVKVICKCNLNEEREKEDTTDVKNNKEKGILF